MKSKRPRQVQAYTLDLTKMQGKGDFLCPLCRSKISPDDETEDFYSILEARVNIFGLDELIICCKKCESQIHLTGFSEIQKLSEIEEKAQKTSETNND